jgi:5-methylcytosine-specific restriction protein B
VIKRRCEADKQNPAVAALLDRINRRMVDRGLDPSLTFGPSYFMRPDVADAAVLGRLWRRELLPMLKEYHYGEREHLDRWYPFDAWLTELGLVGTPPAEPAPDLDPVGAADDGVGGDSAE